MFWPMIVSACAARDALRLLVHGDAHGGTHIRRQVGRGLDDEGEDGIEKPGQHVFVVYRRPSTGWSTRLTRETKSTAAPSDMQCGTPSDASSPSPAFSLTAAITLAAAIGANALIFSVVNGVLLKPLPFADPDRLVGVWHVAPGIAPGPDESGAVHLFHLSREGQVFQDIGLWDDTSVTITGRGEPEQVEALMVTDGTLPLLGVRPALGRTFTKEDDAPGPADTVMLSHAYWLRAVQRQPRGDRATLMVNGRGREVIGVLPERFRFLRYNPAVVLPFRFNRAEIFLGNFSYQGVARLKPGVTIEQANADIARLIPTLYGRFPLPPGFTREMFEAVRLGPLVRPLTVDVVGDIGGMLWVLLGTVGIVLLVACANVANLFLVRAEGRQQELAVRMALGAGTKRVARELLAESLLLGVLAGALGVGLAYAGIRLLVYLQPARLPRLAEITLDPIVLGVHAGAVPRRGTAVRPDPGAEVRATRSWPTPSRRTAAARATAASAIAPATRWWWRKWRSRWCCSWRQG